MKINTNGKKTSQYPKTFFSVIIPCFNGDKYIAQSIKSVLSQTYSNFELIIINDGSTDNSLKVIEQFASQDRRIRFISHKHNQGLSISRNRGLDLVRGEFVALLDCDDWWPEEKLAVYAEKHKQGYDLVFSCYDIFSERANKITRRVMVPSKLSYKSLLYSNHIPLSSVTFNFKKILHSRFNDPGLSEDWIFWLQTIKNFSNPLGIQTSLMFYRQHDENMSHNKFKMLKRTWNIFRTEQRWGIVRSSYGIFRYIYTKFRRYYL